MNVQALTYPYQGMSVNHDVNACTERNSPLLDRLAKTEDRSERVGYSSEIAY